MDQKSVALRRLALKDFTSIDGGQKFKKETAMMIHIFSYSLCGMTPAEKRQIFEIFSRHEESTVPTASVNALPLAEFQLP
jgi:hypothetical protein